MMSIEKSDDVADVPAFATLKTAAPRLGWSSADALRMAFRSGRLPQRFLIRAGRSCRVDVGGLVAWLREEARARETDEQKRRAAMTA